MNRITPSQPQPARPAPPESVELPRHDHGGDKRRSSKKDLLTLGTGISINVLLFVVALLVAAVVWFIYSSSPASQAKYVDTAKLQAVFLNTGQVYFGNVTSLNKDYLVLTNVYYLQSSNTNNSNASNSDASNPNITLVKLGCELHMPYDRMVVNTTQVTFWENLKSDGQVAKAVATYEKQNPTAQCSNQGSSKDATSNLQNSSNATTNKQ